MGRTRGSVGGREKEVVREGMRKERTNGGGRGEEEQGWCEGGKREGGGRGEREAHCWTDFQALLSSSADMRHPRSRRSTV